KLLQLPPKLLDRILHRPPRPVGQAANGRPRHDADVFGDFVQNLQIFQAALAAAEAFGDFEHPAGAFAAGGALAAGFVAEETADVVEHVNDAGVVVDDRDGGGAEAQAADAAGAVEVERGVEFIFGHEAHADAAGDD